MQACELNIFLKCQIFQDLIHKLAVIKLNLEMSLGALYPDGSNILRILMEILGQYIYCNIPIPRTNFVYKIGCKQLKKPTTFSHVIDTTTCLFNVISIQFSFLDMHVTLMFF